MLRYRDFKSNLVNCALSKLQCIASLFAFSMDMKREFTTTKICNRCIASLFRCKKFALIFDCRDKHIASFFKFIIFAT